MPANAQTLSAKEIFKAHCEGGVVALDTDEIISFDLSNYTVDFLNHSSTALVVTFEAGNQLPHWDPRREGWAVEFVRKQGLGVLAVKASAADWYRKSDLHRFMRSLEAGGFFSCFKKVVFYGSSMGGFGALAFSRIAPGAIVLAYAPQTSLAPEVVPWDTRYAHGSAEDWSTDFADGTATETAARVVVVYDPFHSTDRAHVERLPRSNLILCKAFFLGHAVIKSFQSMGVLGEIFAGAVHGNLDRVGLAKIARRRREIPDYWLQMARRARSSAVAKACLKRAQESSSVAPHTLAEPAIVLSRLKQHAIVLTRWKQVQEAIDAGLLALAHDPQSRPMIELVARLYFDLGKIGPARDFALRGLALDPENVLLDRLLKKADKALKLPPTRNPMDVEKSGPADK